MSASSDRTKIRAASGGKQQQAGGKQAAANGKQTASKRRHARACCILLAISSKKGQACSVMQ